MAGVPASVIPQVKTVLAEMQAGRFTRFDIFSFRLKDNQGQLIIPAGKRVAFISSTYYMIPEVRGNALFGV